MEKNKKNKNQGCLNLRCSVIVSYIVSISSNILLSAILFLSDRSYKLIGILLHIVVLLIGLYSLRNVLKKLSSPKNCINYRRITKYFKLSISLTGFFYLIVIIYHIVKKEDLDIIYYFAFCIIIWCIFHGLFISIITSFIKSLEDRPAKKSTEVKLIDKNLRDLIINSNQNDI